MECLSFCIADSIDLAKLDAYLKTADLRFSSIKLRDVLKMSHSNGQSIHIFNNGTVVSWNIKRHQIKFYLNLFKQFSTKPIKNSIHDEFSYVYSDKIAISPHGYFDVDCISLTDDDEMRLTFSYALSQSVKLQYFERILEGLIEKYTPIIRSQAKHGKLPITRTQIREAIVDIITANSELNLISNFFYHPKYFWQHPTLEEYYIILERYLHVSRRVHAINQRLEKLNGIFDMFNSYLENRHMHNLELIVIILISIEIVFGVLNFHF
jgi:uncharacterized Rmd1/YagE family protein